MRQYIYKAIISVIALIIIFEFTLGKTITKYEKKIDTLFSKDGRKSVVISIKNEKQKAIDKENYLSEEERVLFINFINKIKKELELEKQ